MQLQRVTSQLKPLPAGLSNAVDGVAAVAACEIVEFTKGIKFAANTVSKAMDAANGGVLANGGWHRLFGGHSLVDFDMWQKYGGRYPVELAKDFLTKNGLPLPGVQTLVENKLVSVQFATKFGSLNIGGFLGGSLGFTGSLVRMRKLQKDPAAYDDKMLSTGFTGTLKILSGSMSANPVLLLSGIVDVGIASNSLVRIHLGSDHWQLSPLDPVT